MRNLKFICLLLGSIAATLVLKGSLGLSLGDEWFDRISYVQGAVAGTIITFWIWWPDKG